MFSLITLVATACGSTTRAPVELSQCSIASRVYMAGYEVTYTFRLTNTTNRSIVMTRLGFQPWKMSHIDIPLDRSGGLVYDDERILPPMSSHFVYLHTSEIPGKRDIFALTHLPCKTVAVIFKGGEKWAAGDTLGVP